MGRTLFLREYASFISDAMITELMDYPRNMMLSIDIIPVAMDEAVSDIRKRIMSVESDITRWQQRQNQNNNFTANIPYDLEQMRSETKEFMDDLMSRDQRMMLALVTLTHLADNLEQLDQDTEALQAIGRARGCQFNVLRYQQEDALNTVLPLGLKRIDATRTLTTGFSKPSKGNRYLRAKAMGGSVTIPGEGSAEAHSSGSLSAMIGCNCLVKLPAGSGPVAPGEEVEVLSFVQ